MNVLRRLTVVIVIIMGSSLGTVFSSQVEPSHPYCIPNIHLCKWDGTINTGSQICNSNHYPHGKGNYGYCVLCEDPSAREGITQLIDLDDEGALALDQNRSGKKASASGKISACHYLRKVTSSSLPLYLLKSSFLL